MRLQRPLPSQLTKKIGVDVSDLPLEQLWSEIERRAPLDTKTANITSFNFIRGDVLNVTVIYIDKQQGRSGYHIEIDLINGRVRFKTERHTADYDVHDWLLVLQKLPQLTPMSFKNAIPAKKKRKEP
jgi:hypothetical protein